MMLSSRSTLPTFQGRYLLIILVLVLTAGWVKNGQASDASDKLIQQARSELRTAESHMHNGEREAAAKGVQAVAELLHQVREMDPDHGKLALLIGNTEKLRDTLEKRMETTIPLRTDPVEENSDGGDVLPEDAEALARLAGDLLRAAEGEMHNGRPADAKAQLERAVPAVAKLREVDPEHKKLMALETALENQSRTVSERLAASSGAKSPAAGSGPKPATSTAAAPDAKLPYHTRNLVRGADQEFDSAERSFQSLADGSTGFSDESLLGRIGDRLRAIEAILPTLQETAAKDGVADDPRVLGVETRLNEMRARLAEAQAGSTARAAAAAEAQGSIDEDVSALRATYDRLYDAYFSKATGSPIYYNDLDAPRETLTLIETFESEELAAAQAELDAFTAKYGATREEVDANTGDSQAWYPCEGIRDGIANIAKTRAAMADDLVSRANQIITGLPSLHDLYRMAGHDNARGFLKLAAAYSPDHPSVLALSATIDQTLDADLQEYVRKIEDTPWPGNTNSGDARAALKFFQEDIGWGRRDENPRAEDKEPRRPIGIAVIGDWSVQARNLLGNPTMYGLPVLVAVQLDREKPMGLARVYSVTMRTAESGSPEMKPPFTTITVGDSYFIKAAKVK